MLWLQCEVTQKEKSGVLDSETYSVFASVLCYLKVHLSAGNLQGKPTFQADRSITLVNIWRALCRRFGQRYDLFNLVNYFQE